MNRLIISVSCDWLVIILESRCWFLVLYSLGTWSIAFHTVIATMNSFNHLVSLCCGRIVESSILVSD